MTISKQFTPLENSRVELKATISKEDVLKTYDDIIKKYMKSAVLPGFRKGHAPKNILENKFGDSIKAEAGTTLIDNAMNEIFSDKSETKNRPLPYAQPTMDSFPPLDLEKDFSFTITYDVFPEVEIKNISGITIKEVQAEMSDKDVENELKAIQERNATVIDKKETETVESGNIVTVNYAELDENGNEIEDKKRNDFVFTAGEHKNVYGIDDDVLGMKAGETKEIVKSDDEGKSKKIRITVTKIKIKNLPALDDELAQDVNEKYKTLDDLKADIRKNIEHAAKKRVQELKNNSLLSALIENNDFVIPASMLEAELEARWRMMAGQFQTTPQKLEKVFGSSADTKNELFKTWSGESEKMLKSRIIVDTLLKERNITVTPEELESEYARLAEESGMKLDEIKKHYEDPRMKEYLIDEKKERKLYDELYKEVKVEKGEKMTVDELFAHA